MNILKILLNVVFIFRKFLIVLIVLHNFNYCFEILLHIYLVLPYNIYSLILRTLKFSNIYLISL